MSEDDRVVYGASCVWWDYIASAVADENGLPCCPHCRGVLYEMPRGEWEESIERYTKESGDMNYPFLWAWLKGKCYRTLDAARFAYERRDLG